MSASPAEVTATLMELFARLRVEGTQALLRAAADSPALTEPLVRFERGEPARLVGDFELRFAIGTEKAPTADEVEEHLQALAESPRRAQVLYVLTVGEVDPALRERYTGNPRVTCLTFDELDSAAAAMLDDPAGPIPEAQAALLRELRGTLEDAGLAVPEHDVVIVSAGGPAHEHFQALHGRAYVCEPGRPFRADVPYLAFYAGQAVQPEISRRTRIEDAVIFSESSAEAWRASADPDGNVVAQVIRHHLEAEPELSNEPRMVTLLEPHETLPAPVTQDRRQPASERGPRWTQGVLYTSLATLRRARWTSEL